MGDYNCEVVEQAMHVFCETNNLKNLIKVPTCFKNPDNPSCIDLILSNKSRNIFNTRIIETGLSDHHKMCITVTRAYLPKMKPNYVNYRRYKNFDLHNFRYDLNIAMDMTTVNILAENANIFLTPF